MKTPDRIIDRFTLKHPNFGIPNLILYLIVANVAVFSADLFSGGLISGLLSLEPRLILSGQVWRAVTFVLVPTSQKPIWFVVSMFFYYFMGTTMEREWGTAKFTLFYLTGSLLTLIAAFLCELCSIWIGGYGLYYIHQSLFLAFATLYPEAPMRFYFIIPIKAKWLAALWLFLQVYDIISLSSYLIPLLLPTMLFLLLSALLNYLLYFWEDVGVLFGRAQAQRRHQSSSQTINFKKAQKELQQRRGYLHKCSVCGVTDQTDPNMEFRYCSKCNGYYCYCTEHLSDHVHIK